MTPEETAAVLAWATGHDRRHETGTVAEAEIRRRIWATALEEVPFDFAKAYVDRHYRKPDAPEVKPSHVLWAWRTDKRVQESRHQETPAIAGSIGGWQKRPGWFDAYMAAVDEARGDWSVIIGIVDRNAREAEMAAARVRVQNVPLPVQLVDRDQSRENRCQNHDVCVCPHTQCHDGWLLAADFVTNLHGDIYEAVRRCSACFDVVLMRGELSSTGKGRR